MKEKEENRLYLQERSCNQANSVDAQLRPQDFLNLCFQPVRLRQRQLERPADGGKRCGDHLRPDWQPAERRCLDVHLATRPSTGWPFPFIDTAAIGAYNENGLRVW